MEIEWRNCNKVVKNRSLPHTLNYVEPKFNRNVQIFFMYDEDGEEHAAFFTDESPDVTLIVPREVLELMLQQGWNQICEHGEE